MTLLLSRKGADRYDMRLQTLPALLGAILLMPSLAMSAGVLVFDWAYSGNGVTAFGKLSADPAELPPGEYLVTDFQGVRNGNPITNFFANTCSGGPGCISTFPDATVDNLLYYRGAGAAEQINVGIIYTTVDGSFNIYYNDPSYGFGGFSQDYEYTIDSRVIPGAFINLFVAYPEPPGGNANSSVVPEPAAWLTALSAGLVCLLRIFIAAHSGCHKPLSH